MSTPAALKSKYIYQMSVGFKSLNNKQLDDLVTFFKNEDNWKYSENNTNKIFTNAFGNRRSDIEYFERVVFEQFLNKQRRVPSNDTVVFEN